MMYRGCAVGRGTSGRVRLKTDADAGSLVEDGLVGWHHGKSGRGGGGACCRDPVHDAGVYYTLGAIALGCRAHSAT